MTSLARFDISHDSGLAGMRAAYNCTLGAIFIRFRHEWHGTAEWLGWQRAFRQEAMQAPLDGAEQAVRLVVGRPGSR
jgi:hypothetical protein